ncbi:unnamed protein product [Protopolystoma xenopodis]|uniref:Uncharacterized protein n=1 Tax=Protopolystoma xenopodis TaxID=117903 RepID=A0A3S5B6Z6_9PLAT|nr:unnamed protein product [Protopolystoma xenopodis]
MLQFLARTPSTQAENPRDAMLRKRSSERDLVATNANAGGAPVVISGKALSTTVSNPSTSKKYKEFKF